MSENYRRFSNCVFISGNLFSKFKYVGYLTMYSYIHIYKYIYTCIYLIYIKIHSQTILLSKHYLSN